VRTFVSAQTQTGSQIESKSRQTLKIKSRLRKLQQQHKLLLDVANVAAAPDVARGEIKD